MYRKQSKANQNQIQFVFLDDLVPKDHILREIDKAIDFSFQTVDLLKIILKMGVKGDDFPLRVQGSALPGYGAKPCVI